jgi:hypothetical protein
MGVAATTVVAGAAIVGTGAAIYGAVNSYEAAQTAQDAARIQVLGSKVAVESANLRVTAAELSVLGPQIAQSAAEQKRIAALFSGEAAARGFEFEGAVAHRNSIIKTQDADYARGVGEVMAWKEGMESRFKQGTAKVAQAASGTDVNFGSNVAVRQSIASIGKWNQDTVRANAAKAAYGYDVEAANFLAQEQLDQMSAANARTAGELGAKGAEYEKEAARLAEGGALLAVEGAKLSVKGAELGIPAAEFAVTAAGYGGPAAIASGIGSVSTKWMDASRVGLGTSGTSGGVAGPTEGDYFNVNGDVT